LPFTKLLNITLRGLTITISELPALEMD
jgi:hypothetical protein